jgi:hypothetical protein
MNTTAEAVVEDAAKQTAVAVRARAIRSINKGPASGIIYPAVINVRGTAHQSSAPGQPPMADTGRLANSIKWEQDSKGYVVGTAVDYGLFLEAGTSTMKPRPWLVPAVEAELPKFRERLVKAIRRLGGGG